MMLPFPLAMQEKFFFIILLINYNDALMHAVSGMQHGRQNPFTASLKGLDLPNGGVEVKGKTRLGLP